MPETPSRFTTPSRTGRGAMRAWRGTLPRWADSQRARRVVLRSGLARMTSEEWPAISAGFLRVMQFICCPELAVHPRVRPLCDQQPPGCGCAHQPGEAFGGRSRVLEDASRIAVEYVGGSYGYV